MVAVIDDANLQMVEIAMKTVGRPANSVDGRPPVLRNFLLSSRLALAIAEREPWYSFEILSSQKRLAPILFTPFVRCSLKHSSNISSRSGSPLAASNFEMDSTTSVCFRQHDAV